MKDTLTPFLERFKKNLEEQAKEAMEMSLSHAVKLAKENHKYKDQSGGLTDSTVSRPVKKEGMVLVGEIANTSRLALFIHEGTGKYGPKDKAVKEPYEIVPKTEGGWLIFEGSGKKAKAKAKKSKKSEDSVIRSKGKKNKKTQVKAGEKSSLKGSAGKLVKVKKVIHPGIHPDPFLVRALHDTESYFLKKLQGAFNKAVRMSVKK